MSEEFCSKTYNSQTWRDIKMPFQNLKEEICACVRLFKTLFCEKTLHKGKKKPFIPWQGTRFRLHHLDNTPDSDLTPPTHLSMKAVHTRYRRLKTTLGWLPLVLALMNGTHRSHAAHLSEWPSLPAQLKSGDLPHSHCQLKYPVRTQTGNKTK